MKILFIQHDARLVSGVAQVTLKLIDQLSKNNIASCVVLPEEGELCDALRLRKMNFLICPAVVFPGHNLNGAYRYLDGILGRAVKIRDFIYKEKIDVVHTNTIFIFEGALAAMQARIPHVWHIHNNFARDSTPVLFNALHLSKTSMARLYGLLSDYIVGVSNDSVSFFQKYGAPCPIHVIHNGLNAPSLDKAIEPTWNIRKTFEIPQDAPIVGTVCRITRQKNLLLLADSAKLVLQQVPNAHFIVIGPEDDLKYAKVVYSTINEHGIQNNFHFLGSRNDLPQIYPQLDIFVLSSDWEGLPTVCLEAMSAELPIVATLCGGTDELIDQERTGYLVDRGDINLFADKIIQLLRTPEKAVEMGKLGRKKLIEHFSLDKFGNAFESIYQDAMIQHNQEAQANRLLATEIFISLIQQNINMSQFYFSIDKRLMLIEMLVNKIQATLLYRIAKSIIKFISKLN